MDKKKISKVIAKKAVKVLDASLRVEANTASCVVLYQPKAPEALTKFKRKKETEWDGWQTELRNG